MQNNDKSLYLCSEKAKTCPLCKKRYSRIMVPHFISQHPNDEVFVSRISPQMVDYIAPENVDHRTFIKFVKNHSVQLQTVCIFCETMKSFPADYWPDHYRSHTGEYANLCEVCDKICSTSNHCNVGTTRMDNFDLRTENMIAYRCNECNYVQTDQHNIRTHLEKQHDLYDAGERNFQVFTLLPRFCDLARQNDPNVEQIQGKRKCCKFLLQIFCNFQEKIHFFGHSLTNFIRAFFLKILYLGAKQASPAQNNQSLLDLLNQPQKQCNQSKIPDQQPPQASDRSIQILETVVIRPAISQTTTPSMENEPSASIRRMWLFYFFSFPSHTLSQSLIFSFSFFQPNSRTTAHHFKSDTKIQNGSRCC